MTSITIRQAVLADLDAVVTLFDAYRQFYGQPSDAEAARTFLQARFEHGQSVMLLAESQGQAVGFTQLYPSFSSVSMARVFVLNDLFVALTARRLGVGRSLVDRRRGPCSPTGRCALVLDHGCAELACTSLVRVHGLGA
jgi:GNAT superfamily N-acetyltransferase